MPLFDLSEFSTATTVKEDLSRYKSFANRPPTRPEMDFEMLLFRQQESQDRHAENLNFQLQQMRTEIDMKVNNLMDILSRFLTRIDHLESANPLLSRTAPVSPLRQPIPSAAATPFLSRTDNFSAFLASTAALQEACDRSDHTEEYYNDDDLTVSSVATSVPRSRTSGRSNRSRYPREDTSALNASDLFTGTKSAIGSVQSEAIDKKFLPNFLFRDREDLDRFNNQFKLYEIRLGNKSFLQALQDPHDPKKPNDTNYNSYCTKMPKDCVEHDDILAYLYTIWTIDTATGGLLSRLKALKMKPTTSINLSNFQEYLRLFTVEIASSPYEMENEKLSDKKLVKTFRHGMSPNGEETLEKWKISTDQSWDAFSSAVLHHCIHATSIIKTSVTGTPLQSPSTNRNRTLERTSEPLCSNPICIKSLAERQKKSPDLVLKQHQVRNCRQGIATTVATPLSPSITSSATTSHPPNRKTKKVAIAPIATDIVTVMAPPVVIVDSGSGTTIVPSHLFTSKSRRSNQPMMTLVTANSAEIQPTDSGDFRGIKSYVVPQFPDILLGLLNLLKTNFAIATDKEMVIIESTKKTKKLYTQFCNSIISSIKFVAKVTDGIYQLDIKDLPSKLISNSTPNTKQ